MGIENMKDDAENLLEAHLKSSLSNVADDAQKEEEVAEEDDDKENQNMQENTHRIMQEENLRIAPIKAPV